jgi:hypothetical protein
MNVGRRFEGRQVMSIRRKSGRFLGAICCGAVGALLCMTASAGGRPDGELRNWFGEFSGGWTFTESSASSLLDDDLMLSGGALLWPADWPIGLRFELGYAKLDVSSDAIRLINDQIALDPDNAGQIDSGDVRTWGLAINGVWGPGQSSNGLYLTAGVGAYYMKGRLASTGLVYYPPFCDPWFWWACVPGGFGPGSVVQASDSTTRFGWNAGLGYSVAMGGGQLYLEAKYSRIDTPSSDLAFVPVTVGYRW